jgi:hypothetical protein
VSCIIGKAGEQVKQMQGQFNVRMQISQREEGMSERAVSISGDIANVKEATLHVARTVQSDPNLASHMNVNYGTGLGIELGLGGNSPSVVGQTASRGVTGGVSLYSIFMSLSLSQY